MVLTASGIAPFSYQVIDTAGQLMASSAQLLSGPYAAIVTDSSLCQDTLFFEVPALDSINAFATIEPATESSLGSITLDSLIGGTPPYAYEWDNGHTGPSLSTLEPGVYSLTVTDANGCIASFSFEVKLASGLNDISAQAWRLFPNPTAQKVYVELPSGEPAIVRLFDGTGQLALAQKSSGGAGRYAINLEQLTPGMYWVQAITRDGALLGVKRLVIL
ncbi:MAG: T9SS type A sorting domain-containing protein [bacterium]|nr:T9SS type A sorting domain-containing protein [bacterium]